VDIQDYEGLVVIKDAALYYCSLMLIDVELDQSWAGTENLETW